MKRSTAWSSLICLWLLGGCAENPDEQTATPEPQTEQHEPKITTPEPVAATNTNHALFVDVTDEVGLAFEYRAHPAGSYHLPGIMGGGAAVFDANGDGLLDIYLINGHDGTPQSELTNRLFLQAQDGSFEDATEASNLGDRGYGMGCAVGDIDNDGDLDVYITNYGLDRLYRNEGDGTFTDISQEAGVRNAEWGASVAFLDFDRDGWLDVYITNYVDLDENKTCEDDAGQRDYCGPGVFPGVADRLYRNRGDGTFIDATESSGISGSAYAGLGVVCADFDNDGWIDIYVANDLDPNLLWLNQGDGTFIDDAIILGAAYNTHGRTEAGMGVTAGDVDEDGDLDLFVTHFVGETNTLYRNDDGIAFDDTTAGAQLGIVSMPYVGWGTAFFDADLDGDLDLAVANGAVRRRSPVLRDDMGFWSDYAEPNLMFRNDGRGRFEHLEEEAGSFAVDIEISRGLIPVDIDADGDLDLLVTNIAGPARLYRNETNAASWLAITVYDPDLNREALGAKVVIRTEGRSYVRHAIPPGGYLTGAPATIHLGIPDHETVTGIDVRWPDGAEERFVPEANGRIELRRGSGVTIR